MKNRNGITLIALVITVLIIIILAGVSLNIILGENGIMNKAKIGREQHKIEDIRERLDLVKGSDYIKEQGKSSIDTYFETLNKEKIKPYEVTNTEKLTNYIGSIEVDNKYSYLITIENNKDIKIEYEGKIEEIDRSPDEIEIEIIGEREQPNLPVSLVAKAKTNGNIIQTGKFIINDESEKIGTEENLYTNEISNGDINITVNEVEKNYYIHTLTIDKYGRKQESVKGPIVVMSKYHEHIGSNQVNGGCYTKIAYHKHTSCQQSCNYTIATSPTGSQYQANCPWCGGSGSTKAIKYTGTHSNSKCTVEHNSFKYSVCTKCGASGVRGTQLGSSSTYVWYTCGKTTSTPEGFDINCGKTETTIDAYTVNY